MPVDRNPQDDFVSQAGKGCGLGLIITVVILGIGLLALFGLASSLKGL